MNIAPETQPKDIASFGVGPQPSPVDASAAALERQLQHELDKRREERFFWIAGIVALIDVISLPAVNLAVCIFLGLFQIAFLLSLAKWLGLEHVAVPLERLFNRYLNDGKGKGERD
ncbi:hypothetical protein NKH82_17985 [Mesorhizobium sp. M0915]|uniref:hypothetical protein n=1 Tax=Mesorhizobium sp. M0915 TaxID=2957027 RepID=UPI0033386828